MRSYHSLQAAGTVNTQQQEQQWLISWSQGSASGQLRPAYSLVMPCLLSKSLQCHDVADPAVTQFLMVTCTVLHPGHLSYWQPGSCKQLEQFAVFEPIIKINNNFWLLWCMCSHTLAHTADHYPNANPWINVQYGKKTFPIVAEGHCLLWKSLALKHGYHSREQWKI